jgi:hypothetical protein
MMDRRLGLTQKATLSNTLVARQQQFDKFLNGYALVGYVQSAT